MLYQEYDDFKLKYNDAQSQCDQILKEKESLFLITQPKAVDLDRERVVGGENSNVFDTYLIKKQEKRIDERLDEAKSILENRQMLLKMKEEELRRSKDWNDQIYRYYFIDRCSVKQISRRIPYSTRQIFRLIKDIKNNLKDGTRCH